MNHNCNFFFLHELSWCASSDVLIQWRIFHMNHNCNFFLHLRVSWCAYSDVLIEWRFLYKYHTYNVYVLHELSGCASSDFLIQWRIFPRIAFVIPLSFMNCLDVLTQISDWFLYELLIHEFDQKFCYIYCIQKFWLPHEQFLCVCLWIDWLKISFRNFHIMNFLDESISTFKRWLWKLFRGALLFSWCYFPKPFIYNLTRNVIDFGK